MLFPKKVKHRKWQKFRKNPAKADITNRGIQLEFGSYGMKSLDERRVTSRQIEAARKTISRSIGKGGKIWIRVFPDMPVTEKPPEVKLGGGKGDVEGFCSDVAPGRILFEVDGVGPEQAREALRKGAAKLPVTTKFVVRE
jgi:large subunit ribosomal protein L16